MAPALHTQIEPPSIQLDREMAGQEVTVQHSEDSTATQTESKPSALLFPCALLKGLGTIMVLLATITINYSISFLLAINLNPFARYLK